MARSSVRTDNGRFLRGSDLTPDGDTKHFVAWSESADAPVLYDPSAGRYQGDGADLACFGAVELDTPRGKLACRPAFDVVAEACRRISLAEVEAICGVGPRPNRSHCAHAVGRRGPSPTTPGAASNSRPVPRDIARAIAQLYALTGCLDDRGGNVLFTPVPTANVGGTDIPAASSSDSCAWRCRSPAGPLRALVTSPPTSCTARSWRGSPTPCVASSRLALTCWFPTPTAAAVVLPWLRWTSMFTPTCS